LARNPEEAEATRRIVGEVLASVQAEGFSAVKRYTKAFDRVDLELAAMAVSPAHMAAALARLRVENPPLIVALEAMIGRVRRFAEAQRESLSDALVALPGGGSVGERWVPLQRVGVYVPGGRAFYPSTLVMTVVPAQVAGVGRIVAVTPPHSAGVDPLILATAALLGVEELLTLGGAQAIAWLAYGEPQVDLIAGPGNRFVAEAKRQMIGLVGIDSVAGPTELLVLADSSADPVWVAEDLLAQAEHDPDAAAVVIADDDFLLQAVARELAERAGTSPRRDILARSLADHSRLFLADRDIAIAFAQAWAPEHLELMVRDPEGWVPYLTTAGALFVGASSAEAFGDYGAGPNHVLPTQRTARFASPLGVATFLKRQSLLRLTAQDAADLASPVAQLAQAESLPHHAASAALRRHPHP
jgi:histidinol dehydrogenase